MENFFLFSGTSNLALAEKLAKKLEIPLGKIEILRFPDGECRVRIEEKIKGKTVYLLQSLSQPVDENLFELCLMVDSARRLGAKEIVGIIPWLSYQKQDREFRIGEAVSVEVIGKILSAVGLSKIIVFDLHSEIIKSYFMLQENPDLIGDELKQKSHPPLEVVRRRSRSLERGGCHFKIPVIELSAKEVLYSTLLSDPLVIPAPTLSETEGKAGIYKNNYIDSGFRQNDNKNRFQIKSGMTRENLVVISPDKGGKNRAERFAKDYKLPIVYLTKKRDLNTGKISYQSPPSRSPVRLRQGFGGQAGHLEGDWGLTGKTAVIFDDIINRGGTVIKAAEVLKQMGAKKVIVLATHGVLAGEAPKSLQESKVDKIYLTDTIEIPKEKRFSKLKIVSIADLLSQQF